MIPRIRIASLPTPIEAMPRLSAELGGPRLWVKRDDLTGLAFGGNKARKLEFLLAEAQAVGARTLISVGAAQSNHCRQVAALAARFGFACILVLNGDANQAASGNLLLDRILGAEIIWTTRVEREAALKRAFDEAWTAGRRPYLIPLGGSTGLGALGFETAFQEMLAQDLQPDWVVVASSSGGTQAGLALGAWRARWPGKVLGISIDESQSDLQQMVAEIASQAAAQQDRPHTFAPQDILVNADYLGAGYGILGQPEIEAIQLFARTEGLLLDPVYTGRAAAGLVDLVRKGFFKTDETVLFWHTGGTPALFADVYSQALGGVQGFQTGSKS
jgi:D-cysteine desulfhydrase family pyridoxal phosphate-dependent enzyme